MNGPNQSISTQFDALNLTQATAHLARSATNRCADFQCGIIELDKGVTVALDELPPISAGDLEPNDATNHRWDNERKQEVRIRNEDGKNQKETGNRTEHDSRNVITPAPAGEGFLDQFSTFRKQMHRGGTQSQFHFAAGFVCSCCRRIVAASASFIAFSPVAPCTSTSGVMRILPSCTRRRLSSSVTPSLPMAEASRS